MPAHLRGGGTDPGLRALGDVDLHLTNEKEQEREELTSVQKSTLSEHNAVFSDPNLEPRKLHDTFRMTFHVLIIRSAEPWPEGKCCLINTSIDNKELMGVSQSIKLKMVRANLI